MTEPLSVQKMAAVVPLSAEVVEDLPVMVAMTEYFIRYSYQPVPPLTLRERITGRRYWTASNGYTLRLSVGWRLSLANLRSRYRPEPPLDDIEGDDE